jgi:hypothetical protein
MIKRLLATSAVMVGAGAVPVALGAGHVQAATLPLTQTLQPVTAPLQPVLGAVSQVIAAAPAQTAPVLSPAAPPPATANDAAPRAAASAGPPPASTREARPAERSTTTSSSPPPGRASGNAAGLGLVDGCISCSGAAAGPGSSQAQARGLRVLGLDLAGSGGGCDTPRGALIGLPVGSLVTLGVADWSCSSRTAGDSSQASARSALVDLGVDGDEIASATVLEGRSEATYDGSASHGDGVTDGVDLRVLHGAVAVRLLHTEATSEGTRSVEVARVNDLSVLGSQSSDGGVPVDVPGVANVDLLRTAASGGIAGAEVGNVSDVLSSNGQAVGLLATTASGGTGVASAAAPVASTIADVPPPNILAAEGPAAIVNPPITTHGGTLGIPLTGAALDLGGIALLVSGLAGCGIAVRRRRAARA